MIKLHNSFTDTIKHYQRNMIVLIIISFIFQSGCSKDEIENGLPENIKYHTFTSFADFKNTLKTIADIDDQTDRQTRINVLWDSLKLHHEIPFVFEDSVAFLYSGIVSSVVWAGDFNGWSASSDYQGTKVGLSNIWILEKVFPTEARLDYKIIVDGNWILDPANSYLRRGGFGYNSELRMPDWVYPQETILAANVNRGSFSSNIIIHSSSLGYDLQYRVYTPFGYDGLSNLPVIYVTDGQEYSDDLMGAMLIVLDNIIYSNKINPIIAVFIDPRDPYDQGNNKRGSQYTGNIQFANFVADELVPVVDSHYRTDPSAEARAILGASLGGWNSAFFGLNRSDKFRLIGIHSPAFDNAIIQAYRDSSKLPLKIFMSTGVIYDTQDNARAMKSILDAKGYPLLYKEVYEGHSWGNWRALIDDPLIYFFGK
jgi:enterochelin esterase-like enzyme